MQYKPWYVRNSPSLLLYKGENFMKKQFLSIIVICLIIMATNALAAINQGEFSLSPVIGGYTFDSKQHLKTNLVYGGRLGYNLTSNLGVEGLFDFVKTDSKLFQGDFKSYRYGGELLYHFFPENVLVPFVAGGAGIESIENNKGYSRTRAMYDYGLGLKYFLTDNFAIRGDVRHILYSYDSVALNNIEYTIGAYIPFGGAQPAVKPVVQEAAQPKAAPVEPKVVIEPTPQPSSNLSISPSSIKQGETAKLSWTSRDATDCSIQPGVGSVSLQGEKSVTPSSNASYTLNCTGPGGSSSSNAAVAVVIPQPAPAPKPAPVEQSTQKASAAAARFCNKPAIIEIAFDTNKVDIKPKYNAELKTLADFLAEYPAAKGEISGHTDNVGGRAFNLKLSQRRADSVKGYLVKKFGVDANRITTKGYGLSKPIASNKTKAGKAKNRRIEANFTCGE